MWACRPSPGILSVFASFAILLTTIVSADTRATATASPAEVPCSVTAGYSSIKARPNDVIFTLWSDDEAGLATGTLDFYVGNNRYTVPFTDAVAADYRSSKHQPTAIGVHFDAPTTADSAYVATLDGKPCPIHEPFVSQRIQIGQLPEDPDETIVNNFPKWKPILDGIAAAAQTMPAPAPELVAAPACDHPYVHSKTTWDGDVRRPIGGTMTGLVYVTVAIRSDGSLAGTRVDAGFRESAYNIAATQAAKKSRFAAEIYRCEPVSGVYHYLVYFGQ